MTYKFADIHCHPIHQIYNRFNPKHPLMKKSMGHPWNIARSNPESIDRGVRGSDYSASDFARLIKGNVKIVWASLYPLEQAFFDKLNDKTIIQLNENEDALTNIADLDTDEVIKKYTYNPKWGFNSYTRYITSQVPPRRISAVRGKNYNYFKDFIKVYQFILSKSGIKSTSTNKIWFDKNRNGATTVGEKEHVTGTYTIVSKIKKQSGSKSYLPVSNFQSDEIGPKETLVFLTMEGANIFSMKNMREALPLSAVLNNVSYLKSLDPPIWMITFCHHFYNALASHARSLPRKIKALNQNKYLNSIDKDNPNIGINSKGIQVIYRLLGIRENNEILIKDELEGHRILVDVKHMSAAARKNFYYDIIEKYNQHNPDDTIPVIASHIGYSGWDKLEEQINNYPHEISNQIENGFMQWNINLCGEDIRFICTTKGLIGICFDQRVLGLEFSKFWDGTNSRFKKQSRKESIEIISRQIQAMVDSTKSKGYHVFKPGNPHSVWNCLSIGSDFDGMIDPVDAYPTSWDFQEFAIDLKDKMLSWNNLSEYGISNSNIDTVIEQICIDNVVKFTERNFK